MAFSLPVKHQPFPTWSWELQYLNSTTLSLVKPMRKWILVSICLLLKWKTGFLDNFIIELLSHWIKVLFSSLWASFSNIVLSQTHNTKCSSYVLGLGSRQCHYKLFLRRPWNCSKTKKTTPEIFLYHANHQKNYC